jgi:hypothetical protein
MLMITEINLVTGRRDWDRTSDHFHVKEVLYH